MKVVTRRKSNSFILEDLVKNKVITIEVSLYEKHPEWTSPSWIGIMAKNTYVYLGAEEGIEEDFIKRAYGDFNIKLLDLDSLKEIEVKFNSLLEGSSLRSIIGYDKIFDRSYYVKTNLYLSKNLDEVHVTEPIKTFKHKY